MQNITWYRLSAVGVLLVPFVTHAQTPQPNVREIATIPGVAVDNFVRLPNGRVLLYTVADSIVAYDLATKHSALVTRGFFELLRVSLAGDRIVYCRRADIPGGELIWSMPIDPKTGAATGPAQQVSITAGDYPSFSPDGRTIAFNRVRGDSKGQDLAVVPATGGPERIVAKYDKGMKQTLWSDDGKWIYVNVHDMGGPSPLLYVERVPAAGGASEKVFSHSSTVEGTVDGELALEWPDHEGRMSYVAASGARGEFRIPPGSYPGDDQGHVLSLLAKTTRPSTAHIVTLSNGRVRDLVPGTLLGRSPVWSPDGRRLAVEDSSGGRREITVMNADGSQARTYAASWDPQNWGFMQWSPDGRLLAYYSRAASSPGASVAVLDLLTGSARIVSSPPSGGFIWRADGKSLVVLEQSVSGGPRLAAYEVKLDGSERMLRDISAEYPTAALGQGPRPTPRAFISDQLVVVGDASKQFVVPLEGGPPRQLPEGANARFPRPYVSPGPSHAAKWMLWLTQNANRATTRVELMTSSGDSLRALNLPFELDPPVFQESFYHPDGRHIILVGRTPGDRVSKIFLVPLDGSAPRVLAEFSGRLIGRFDLSPDGNSLAYTVEGAPTSTIYELDVSPIVRATGKR